MLHLYCTAHRGGKATSLSFAFLFLLLFPLPGWSQASVYPGCADGTPITYAQDDSGGRGLVVLEAERPTENNASLLPGHGVEVFWQEFTANTAGNATYTSIRTTGQNNWDPNAEGAHLHYDINFTRTGTHYLHLRYWAPNADDNSVHVNFDDAVVMPNWNLPTGVQNWVWIKMPVAIEVTTTGWHDLTINQREDGTRLDRLVITSDASASFSGFGPAVTETVASPGVKSPDQRIGHSQDNRTGQGFIVFEAEKPTNNVSGYGAFACRTWDGYLAQSASGGAFVITDEHGEKSDSFNYRQAPHLDYEIELTQAGTHYLWVRHWGLYDDNSLYVTANGALLSEFKVNYVDGRTNWEWQRMPEAIYNPTAQQTVLLQIYMREDYTPLDKFIITTDPNFVPAGFGTPSTIESPPDLVYQQSAQPGHLVELPMERPSRNRAGTNHYEHLRWTYHQDAKAEDGAFARVNNVNPGGANVIIYHEEKYLTAIQEFDIDFVTTGTHYLYVRHSAPTGDDNSYYYYLDGVKLHDKSIDVLSPDGWNYDTDPIPTLNIPTVGRHRLAIGMREDGTPIDHLILSTEPNVSSSVMPITLTDFSATEDGTGNRINWVSESEENTSHHLVERSTDGLDHWSVVGRVAAAGHSTQARHYAFPDPSPPARCYYRLTTVDHDGTRSTSSIVAVLREADGAGLRVFPNPASDLAVLSFDHPGGTVMDLRITSIQGRTIARRSVTTTPGSNRIELPLHRLPNGTFIVSTVLDGRLITRRLVVTH